MRSPRASLALIVAIAAAIMAVAEVAMHNLGVAIALQMETLIEQRDGLLRQKEDLEATLGILLAPCRLENVGKKLGLRPLPVERFAVVEPSTESEDLE
ncbi:hypothetical protein GF402_03800 [Candidatus Fermentibacteria bacterium]|nr:hypothetical protein [Candidatus Fermentibacteria bacterium]